MIMSGQHTQVLAAALALDKQSRSKLARQLTKSVEQEEQAEIDAAWIEEVHRRLDELDRGVVPTIPADELFKTLGLPDQPRTSNSARPRSSSCSKQSSITTPSDPAWGLSPHGKSAQSSSGLPLIRRRAPS
jgi:putative addiction module component (TIGR02574 family)